MFILFLLLIQFKNNLYYTYILNYILTIHLQFMNLHNEL